MSAVRHQNSSPWHGDGENQCLLLTAGSSLPSLSFQVSLLHLGSQGQAIPHWAFPSRVSPESALFFSALCGARRGCRNSYFRFEASVRPNGGQFGWEIDRKALEAMNEPLFVWPALAVRGENKAGVRVISLTEAKLPNWGFSRRWPQ